LLAYGDATQKTFNDTVVKYVFTVIPIGLTMAGAVIAGAGPGLVIAGSAGLVELARFWNVDRKPVIADGDLDAAAMVHDDDDGKRIERLRSFQMTTRARAGQRKCGRSGARSHLKV
jgi:hypothetical protein